MASVVVTAPARLHLGFIDPDGSLGRRFGSLGVARAVARLFKLDVTLAELARLTGRGRRSGIGVTAFARGGFILDSGGGKVSDIPTVIFRHPFPEEWRFVVVVPDLGEALHGAAEG